MKLAIPSNDQLTISGHFGRTAGFMIFEIEDNKVVKKEFKTNTFTGHAHGQHHENNHGTGQHSHAEIFNALGDCKTVIAGVMGRRLFNDFMQKEIQVFISREQDIDKALDLFLNNSLDNNSDQCCNH